MGSERPLRDPLVVARIKEAYRNDNEISGSVREWDAIAKEFNFWLEEVSRLI